MNKFADSLSEILYGSVMVFVYYYLYLTIIGWEPFSIGFHPPTDLTQLALSFGIIVLGMSGVKLLQLFIAACAPQVPANNTPSTPYFPSFRKGI